MIFWLPLLLVSLFSVFWVLWFIQQNLKVSSLCHRYVLMSQEAIVERNNQIMNLNSQARWLWAEKKALDAVILTGPPPAKAAAKVRRKFVVWEQKSLRTIQKSLFSSGQWKSRRALYQLRKDFDKQVSYWQMFWNSPRPRIPTLNLFPTTSQLAVQIQDIAPTYKRRSSHWISQGIAVHWAIPLSEVLPPWLKTWVPIHKNWQGQCFSHPHRRGVQWKAAIGKGRH